MKIAVTGANGFIGRYVVDQALDNGFEVVAIVRDTYPERWSNSDYITVIQCDLKQRDVLNGAFDRCDFIIHLAAVMSGNLQTQYADTIEVSKNVLAAMDRANVKKLIALSSISVLDYVSCKANSQIDEHLPFNENDQELGCYARMKRDQEKLYQQWQAGSDRLKAVIRPGIVYNDRQISSAHTGFVFGKNCLAAKHSGEVPIVHVLYVAKSIIRLVIDGFNKNITVNLYDDALPKQKKYIEMVKSISDIKVFISLPWQLNSLFAYFLRFGLRVVGKQDKIPDSFRKNSVAARQKPLFFSKRVAKDVFGL